MKQVHEENPINQEPFLWTVPQTDHCRALELKPGTYLCRRVATFPLPGSHLTKKRSFNELKQHRSSSESENIHWSSDCEPATVETLSSQIVHFFINTADTVQLRDDDLSNEVSLSAQTNHNNNRIKDDDDKTTEKCSKKRVRTKKKVLFADDCGYQLVSVELLWDASDCPPIPGPSTLRAIASVSNADSPGDECELPLNLQGKWKLDFKQPASEYLEFRSKLDQKCVCLENVIVKNDILKLVGTIRVRNVAFEKLVFVRHSSDRWNSFKDTDAIFVPGVAGEVFERFQFVVDLITANRNEKVEFCCCFRAGPNGCQGEFWDNNNGINYGLAVDKHEATP